MEKIEIEFIRSFRTRKWAIYSTSSPKEEDITITFLLLIYHERNAGGLDHSELQFAANVSLYL